MLKHFDQNIDDIAVIYAHSGLKPDQKNTIYSIAAAIYSKGEKKKEYQSNIKYSYFSARDRFYSNLSKNTLVSAPTIQEVSSELKTFLKKQKFIIFFDVYNKVEDIIEISGIDRFIDLNFTAEFFYPHIGACTPKTIWEFLQGRERDKISFQASEIVDLSMDFIKHICSTILNDRKTSHAPFIRYNLEKSNTLFGKTFIHIAKCYKEYFGGLFDVCNKKNTPDWKSYLKKASFPPKNEDIDDKVIYQTISKEQVQNLYEGMSKSGNSFKFRKEQVEFAHHVVDALNDSTVLTIEAGTGTGKTQGYLIPAMEFLYRNKDARIAISTYTKSLQEQIFQRELPFTKAIFKQYSDIPIALLKGKTSYICAEKLDNFWDENLIGWQLIAWLYFSNILFDFRNTDLDSIGDRIKTYLNENNFVYKILNEVSARDGCGPKHLKCPAQVLAAEASKSRLIITNHHKLAFLEGDDILSGLFRNYIIDEANLFESAVRNSFGKEIESKEIGDIVEYLEQVLNKTVPRAIGEDSKTIKDIISGIKDLDQTATEMRNALLQLNPLGEIGQTYELQLDHPAFKRYQIDTLFIAFEKSMIKISNLLDVFNDENTCRQLKIHSRTIQRIKRSAKQLRDFSEDFKAISNNIKIQNQITAYQIFRKNWVLSSHSVDISEIINNHFYKLKDSIVFTAATLCNNNSFECFSKITGQNLNPIPIEKQDEKEDVLKEFRFKKIPSPFSKDQLEIYVHEKSVTGGYNNKQSWVETVIDILPDLIRKNKGRTLVLFSSYTDLEQITNSIGGMIEDEGYPLLVQKQGASTKILCDEFRAIKESVLFGVDSFWYGVDFKGDTLTQVVITRIPYKHPSSPIQLARKRTMSTKDYFDRYYFDKDIKIKQGIGRLIRSDTDKGKVVFLDSRYKNQANFNRGKSTDNLPPIYSIDQSLYNTEINDNFNPVVANTTINPKSDQLRSTVPGTEYKDIVCFANSHKYNGCCIAGKELFSEGKSNWIRPVSNRPMGELYITPPPNYTELFPKTLDVLAIPIQKHFPHYYQIENFLIDESQSWIKKNIIKPEELTQYYDGVEMLWINGYNSLGGYNDRIPIDLAFNECTSSLLLIQPKKILINVGLESNKKRVRAKFSFNGVHYSLIVTDQLIKSEYIHKDEGEYDLKMNNISFCISISEPWKDFCYKLVAGVIGDNG